MSKTPASGQQRLYNAGDTAKYLGFKSRDALKNFPVKPVRICTDGVGSKEMWDRKAVDLHLDNLSGLSSHPTVKTDACNLTPEEKLSQWEARNDRRAA